MDDASRAEQLIAEGVDDPVAGFDARARLNTSALTDAWYSMSSRVSNTGARPSPIGENVTIAASSYREPVGGSASKSSSVSLGRREGQVAKGLPRVDIRRFDVGRCQPGFIELEVSRAFYLLSNGV